MYYVKKKWSTAKKCESGGHLYDSKFEAGYGQELDLLLKAGKIKSWERQVPIDLTLNGYIICTYKIDFVVHRLDGITEYVEAKGVAFPVWKLKWKLFEAIMSKKKNVKLTVVQQGNFKVPKARRIKK